ncbi:MAG: hypothetical protein N2506_01605 [Dehalococcoidales bacterium]|nr:hypothetical protein [Dehalococcoidales bacterium]
MAEPRYAKNIVTETREYTPEELQKIQEMQAKHPTKYIGKGITRLLWMDDTKVPGASFYMECIWLHEGRTLSGTTEEPHFHDFPEVIGFIGTDPDNPAYLDARMEIILGDEMHHLTKSCLVFIPPGMKHCPLTFREVNRPVFFFTLAPISRYGRTGTTAQTTGAPTFNPPEPDQYGSRYARYIITRPKSHWPTGADRKAPPPPPPKAKTSHVVSLDSEVIDGAFYVDFVWIWSGDMVMSPEPHSHDFDEMIGIVSYNPDDWRKVEGVSITLGEEKHELTKSSLIFIPRGLKHCPLEFKNITRPVLCFTIGNAPKFSSQGPAPR